jgi:hypothetical protein
MFRRQAAPVARGEGVALALGAVLAVALVAFLAGFVVAREGGLAWDDADYLRRGLRIAGLATAWGGLDLPRAVGLTLRERPKPPLLVAWIELGGLALGRHGLLPLILFSSVVPFAMLLCGVVAVARRRFGARVAPLAIACVAASPLALSYGAKVMVETFLALWTLLAFDAAAAVLERPTRGRALWLGTTLGLAAMTKLTVALFLPCPALLFLILYARRHPLDRTARDVAIGIVVPLLVIAGPWFLRNGRSAVQFALFSSRYNLLAEGRTDVMPRSSRLAVLGDRLLGWPLLATLPVVAATALGRRGRAGRWSPAAADFLALTAVGAASGAALLLVPAYFDPRFLLPVWPASAVGLGAWLRRWADRVRGGTLLAHAALAAGLVASAGSLHREPATTTYWNARSLIDELVARHGVANLGNVGNCGDWNVCKTGLLNELRADPRDCFVLHDLSRDGPDVLSRRVGRFDAIVVLDPGYFPPGFLASAPGLNRAYDAIGRVIDQDRRFHKVETRLTGLPPLSVYVRRR